MPEETVTDGLKDSEFVAGHLDVPVRTLDQWAYKGVGPRFFKVGRYRRYRMSDVEDWLRKQADHRPAA